MRKGIALGLALLIMMSMVAPIYAKEAKSAKKIEKGVVSIITAPFEVPKQIYNTSNEQNALVGITAGTLKGAASFVVKMLSGIFNVLTAPFGATEVESELFPEQRTKTETETETETETKTK